MSEPDSHQALFHPKFMPLMESVGYQESLAADPEHLELVVLGPSVTVPYDE